MKPILGSSVTDIINVIIQGLMIGGFYAILASGLAMVFGVMKVVNLAHGDLLIFSAFILLIFMETLAHLPFWVVASFAIGLMFCIGYLFQKFVINKTMGKELLPPLLITFGLSMILQNGMLEFFSADSKKISLGEMDSLSFNLTNDIYIGVLPLITFVSAIVLLATMQAFISRTRMGRLIRAASDDPATLAQFGENPKHIYAVAFGISLGICAIAAIFFATTTQFNPLSGAPRLLNAFEAIVIGGVSSIWGALAGALLLGIAQSIGAYIDPTLQNFFGHVLFLIVLVFKPEGLFGRKS